MGAQPHHHVLTARDLEPVLAVTAKLAAPFDLKTMLREVVDAGKQVLQADRGSVWLYEPATEELVLEIAMGIDPSLGQERRHSTWDLGPIRRWPPALL